MLGAASQCCAINSWGETNVGHLNEIAKLKIAKSHLGGAKERCVIFREENWMRTPVNKWEVQSMEFHVKRSS